MTNNLLFSLIVGITYLLLKFIDMRYIKKENKPLKDLIVDSAVVFISSLLTFFFALIPMIPHMMLFLCTTFLYPVIFCNLFTS